MADVLEEVTAIISKHSLHGVHERAPADFVQDQDGDDDQPRAHHDELQEVRNQDAEHASQDRIDGDHHEQQRHHPFEWKAGAVQSTDEH